MLVTTAKGPPNAPPFHVTRYAGFKETTCPVMAFGMTRSALKSKATVAPGAASKGPDPRAEPFENTKEPALTISEPVLELTPEYNKRPEPVFTKVPSPDSAFERIESD